MAKVSFVASRSFAFLKESLAIEGISRNPTEAELAATERFLALEKLLPVDVRELQSVYTPNCPLRTEPGMNVSVGSYNPPGGSSEIEFDLASILIQANVYYRGGSYKAVFNYAFEIHMLFELLHPFMDGNGRTGRTLWAWVVEKHGFDPFKMPFLQSFYYSTLGYFSHRETEFYSGGCSFFWPKHN